MIFNETLRQQRASTPLQSSSRRRKRNVPLRSHTPFWHEINLLLLLTGKRCLTVPNTSTPTHRKERLDSPQHTNTNSQERGARQSPTHQHQLTGKRGLTVPSTPTPTHRNKGLDSPQHTNTKSYGAQGRRPSTSLAYRLILRFPIFEGLLGLQEINERGVLSLLRMAPSKLSRRECSTKKIGLRLMLLGAIIICS